MKIVNNYLEVTEPEIAVLFLGEEIEYCIPNLDDIANNKYEWKSEKLDIKSYGLVYKIRIPKETVKKVCEAKEGEAYFSYTPLYKDWEYPFYGKYNSQEENGIRIFIKATALTISKTVGELRELVEWMEK